MGTVLDWARRYVAAGVSVIPVRADGSKAPAFADWRQFSDRLPTADELSQWFADDGRYGLGVVPGPASGNLLVFDFEVRDGVSAYDVWRAGLSESQAAAADACPRVVTPSGGRHLWVRCPQSHPGTVLARTESGLVFIETRGTGQQVLAPGCPAKCHKSGKEYVFESHGWLPKWN